MPAITKRDRPLRIEFVSNKSASPLGGLPAIEALAQQFGLWKRIKTVPALDRRTRKYRGYGPEVILAQLLYSMCMAGESLADSKKQFADQTTVGEWLRAQTPENVQALQQL